MVEKVAVIGSGTMGNGIAHVFALYGYQVNVFDVSTSALEKAANSIAINIDRQVVKGIIPIEQKNAILNRLSFTNSLKDAVSSVDLVVEAVTEKKDIKLELFKQLDLLTKATCILASNTSSIPIKEIAEVTNRKDKVIGMHFMNPVPVMKLVEVIQIQETDPKVLDMIFEISRNMEKVPVLVQDAPGFISNRVLMPMINEAIYALHEGVAKVNAIDEIMKLGMAHPMGPLRLADLIGLDVVHHILLVLYDGFHQDKKYTPCPLLKTLIDANELGVKTGKGFYDYNLSKKEGFIVSNRFK